MLTCELTEVVFGVNGWLDEVRPSAIAAAKDIEDAQEQKKETEEILEVFQAYDESEAVTMLEVIQGFDPAGVGGRDGGGDMCFFFQAEDGIRDSPVTEFRRVLFRSPARSYRWAAGGRMSRVAVSAYRRPSAAAMSTPSAWISPRTR